MRCCRSFNVARTLSVARLSASFSSAEAPADESSSPERFNDKRGLIPRLEVAAQAHQWITLKCVLNEPALPQRTWIGHLPSVVFPPTFHVQDTRPRTGRLGLRPWACEGPLL
jgi:hypothetical protein